MTSSVLDRPTTAADFETILGDKQRVTDMVGNGTFAQFVKDYADVRNAADTSIMEQVQSETQRVLAEWLRDTGPRDAVKRLNVDSGAGVTGRWPGAKGLYNPRAMGAKIDDEFTDSSDYFRAIWHNSHGDQEAQGKLGRVRNAFSSTVPSEGGFLVPETLRAELLRVSLETSIVRPRARVIPMETLRVPFPAIDSTSNASSVYGGIVGYWTEEAAALTQSQATFGRVVLDAKKLTIYTEVPNELLADSAISFQAFIDDIFPEALGFYEDDAFINGTGVGEPLGFLNGSAVINHTEGGANLIAWGDVIAMYARMLPSSLGRAVWVASINTFPQIATMADPGGAGMWIGGGSGADAPPVTILGRPVIFTEKVPALGTTGALSFVDLSMYLVGDRQVMSAMSSPHYKFQNDMTAYRIIERVDGRPWLNSAITPKNGGATLSPFVTLLSA